MNIFFLSLRNIKRRPFRSIGLILAVLLVSLMFFSGTISLRGVLTSIRLGAQRLGADLMVVPEGYEEKAKTTLIAGKPSVFYMSLDVFEKVKKLKGVKRASPQLFIKSTSYPCCTTVDVLLVGFDPSTDFTVKPWLDETINRELSKDEVIIGASIPVSKDEIMKFFGKGLKVVGHLAPTGLEYIDHAVFMTMETAREMIRESKTESFEPLDIKEDAISTILVQLDPNISPERAQVFVEYNIKGVKAITSQDVIGTVKKQFFVLIRILVGIGFSLWFITLILISVVFSMIINERQREIGILRSLGAKRREVFLIIIFESMLLTSTGAFTGLIAGWFFLSLLKKPLLKSLNLPYVWPGTEFIIIIMLTTVILCILTGILAVLYPAIRSTGLEPYEAIRKGE